MDQFGLEGSFNNFNFGSVMFFLSWNCYKTQFIFAKNHFIDILEGNDVMILVNSLHIVHVGKFEICLSNFK